MVPVNLLLVVESIAKSIFENFKRHLIAAKRGPS